MTEYLLPPFTSTRRGDTSALEGKVLCADALTLLATLPDASIDMVLADLPYQQTQNSWDVMIPLDAMWSQLKRITKKNTPIVLTAIQPFTSILVTSNMQMFRESIIWDKTSVTGFLNSNRYHMRRHEEILVFSKNLPNYYPQLVEDEPYTHKGSDTPTSNYGNFSTRKTTINLGYRYPQSIISFPQDRHHTNHPTQKPVDLFSYLIRTYTREGELVLDMTAGSGTTAIAARKTGRRFICGDLSPEYVSLANTRLQNTDAYRDTVLPDGTRQLSLFSKLDQTA